MQLMPGWKRLSPYALVMGCLLLVSACGATGSVASAGGDSSSSPDAEQVAMLLSGEFETVRGESIDLAELAGEDVVFWFWAPW